MEDCGVVYRYGGEAADPYAIFANKGANIVRLRLWHNPDWTKYGTLADVTRSIRRARRHDMAVLLDFHYSDDWADPGNQIIPAAWRAAMTTGELAQLLHDYTYATLMTLYGRGLLPEYVQVGNEINTVLLLTEEVPGHRPINWERNAILLNAGISAVRRASEDSGQAIGLMLHVAQPENVVPWVDAASEGPASRMLTSSGSAITQNGRNCSFNRVEEVIRLLRQRYGKDVIIVETAYPWTLRYNDRAHNILGADSLIDGYPATQDGQRRMLIDLIRAVLKGGGLGVVYWEPAWVSTRCRTRWGRVPTGRMPHCLIFIPAIFTRARISSVMIIQVIYNPLHTSQRPAYQMI